MSKEPQYFFKEGNILQEHLARGVHDWFSRSDITGSDNIILTRVRLEPGNGHPFHRHPTMDEVIYILSGQAEQWVENQARVLGSGEAAFIPENVVHALYNESDDDVVFLAILSPAGDLDGDGMVDVSLEEPWRSLKAPLKSE